jgi:hypothetical protein
MKVRLELSIPTVKCRDKTQLSAKFIFAEAEQRLRGGLEKDVEHHLFIV